MRSDDEGDENSEIEHLASIIKEISDKREVSTVFSLDAYESHCQRTETLFRMWSTALSADTTDDDEPVIDEIRFQLKKALADDFLMKCVKAIALREVSNYSPDSSEENPHLTSESS